MDIRDGSMLVPVTVTNPDTGKSADAVFRIDTGSDFTAVCLLVAQKIDARPGNFRDVQGVDRDPITAPVYAVDLTVQGCPLGRVEMIGLDFTGLGYAGLIGNDVLDRGLLVRDGESGNWYLTIGSGTCAGTCSTRPAGSYLVAWFLGLALGVAGALLLTRK